MRSWTTFIPSCRQLVFSLVDPKGEDVDGFLDLEDMYNLNLSADLVALSACETALGKEVNGEDMSK
jgi:CHAT domain-containing protein